MLDVYGRGLVPDPPVNTGYQRPSYRELRLRAVSNKRHAGYRDRRSVTIKTPSPGLHLADLHPYGLR